MIKIDGKQYDVPITELGLDVEFQYKFAERNEKYELNYELGAVFYNQSITFATTDSTNKDFVALVQLLSTKSSIDDGTGHEVEIRTPMGKMVFLMYPNKLSMKMKNTINKDTNEEYTKWGGFTVKFIAIKPAERW